MPLLSRDEILFLHAAALQKDGGMPGIRDEGMLDSAVAQFT